MSELSLKFLAPDPWTWILLIIPALALAIYTYYRIGAPLTRPAMWALWILRGLAFLLVLLALSQPVLTAVLRDTGPPGLAVLIDRSSSMVLPSGAAPGESRAQEGERLAAQIHRELSSRYRLQWYSFSDHLRPQAPDSAETPAGNTALGQALEEVLSAAQSRPISGILLLSDGVNTAGRDPVRVAAASPVPISTLGLGPVRAVTDVAVHRVRSNPTGFAGEPFPVQVALASWGMGGKTARVEVKERGVTLIGQDVPLIGQNGLEQEVSLDVRPRAPGLTLYQVSVTAPTDSIPQNNVREIAVEVLERKTRVLVLAPHVDWDFAFLRRILQADTTLSYTFVAQVAPGNFRTYGERGIGRWPQTSEELRPFAAVLLVGLGDEGLPGVTLDAVARFVREGGGLLLLGGPARRVAWIDTGGLADVLPAKIIPDPIPAVRALPVAVTLEGQRHPVTSMSDNPGEIAQLWGGLPPVFRPGGSLAVKPQARVLLEYRAPRDLRLPALAVSFEDRGKSAWLYGRGIWRWGFLPSSDREGTRDFYPQFILGMVRWLSEPAVRDRFQVSPGKRVFQNGEPLAFTAGLWDASYAPVPGAKIDVRVMPDSASQEATPSRLDLDPGTDPGQYDGQAPPLPPGAYRYSAEARDPANGQVIGRTEGRFWCEAMGPELAKTWRDSEQLEQIARRSGGLSVSAANLGDLWDQIPRTIRRLGRIREIEVWNHWLLFVCFVLVLSVEWFLRRRRGLA